MFLNQQIIIHSTDGVTEYTDAKSFIESLANHIKIRTELPADLAMISIGTEAPDQQYQDVPWLEISPTNQPLALKYYDGLEWVETRPYKTIQAPYEGLYVQYGEIDYIHKQATVNTWVDSKTLIQNNGSIGKFLFPEQFKAETTVTVQLTPVMTSIHRNEGAAALSAVAVADVNDWINETRKGFEWALGTDVNYTGFHIHTKTQDIVNAGLPVKFYWMAMGEKA